MRSQLRRAPTVVWTCAAIAFLNGVAWSLITPPFQARDEPDHFAYVQQLAEAGTLPKGNGLGYSPEETLVLNGLHQAHTRFAPQIPALSSRAEQRTLMADVHGGASPKGAGEAGNASSEPPLYYALQTIPYGLAKGNILVQLQLMRLLSALLGAATAVFVFLFLRELMPDAPLPVGAAALCVSLQPLFGYMSGALNPEALLYAISAALFLCLARAFRRGLTLPEAVLFGVVIALGFLSKLNFIGLAFGAFLGLALLAVRHGRSQGWSGVRPFAIAAGIGCAPVVLFALVNLVSNRTTFGAGSAAPALLTGGTLVPVLSYDWQFYLPRLPGMTQYFSGLHTYRDIWFARLVGDYGWSDTALPQWATTVALFPVAAIASLCGIALARGRRLLRSRLAEIATYATMVLGVLAMVGAASYSARVSVKMAGYGDARYLLLLLPLFAAVLAMAIRGAGRGWAPVAAAVLVVVFLGHDVFSQLQEVARYYG